MIGLSTYSERLGAGRDLGMDEHADATAIALDEERSVARIGERASVDVREGTMTAVHPKLALRALELAQCGVRVVHRDRRESFESLGVPRGQIRVRVVHQARDLSLGCDAEEPRNRMTCRWVSAKRECAADLLDERRVV
jgi:hypothetical protein